MTDRRLLLLNVLKHPESDLARGVFADYLDENGEGERAEFIRIQLERHAAGKFGMSKRERKLVRDEWAMPFSCSWRSEWARMGEWKTCWVWRRGFIEQVRHSLRDFLRLSQVMCRSHPLTSITLVDRKPTRWLDGGQCWISDASGWTRHAGNRLAFVPDELYPYLTFDLDTAEDGPIFFNDAHASLNAACVAHARHAAGLPPLPPPPVLEPARRPWLVLPPGTLLANPKETSLD